MAEIIKLLPNQALYPPKLSLIHSAPKQLYLRGSLPEQDRLLVGIVGARAITSYGKAATQKIAGELARAGVGIVSGLALGVDGVALQSALDEDGYTLAIQANGLDRIYPVRNQPLARQMLEKGGALLSEYEAGVPPLKHHFPARNRLIAGLSDALIVTEAAIGSGSLITAQFALDENKTVLALPGNITSAQSEGTNNLIKMGAHPITKVSDIFEALEIHHKPSSIPKGQNTQEQRIIDAIASGIETQDDILSETNLEPTLFAQTLTLLEIQGKIHPLGSGKWSI